MTAVAQAADRPVARDGEPNHSPYVEDTGYAMRRSPPREQEAVLTVVKGDYVHVDARVPPFSGQTACGTEREGFGRECIHAQYGRCPEPVRRTKA
jgi:hypothetical protein